MKIYKFIKYIKEIITGQHTIPILFTIVELCNSSVR